MIRIGVSALFKSRLSAPLLSSLTKGNLRTIRPSIYTTYSIRKFTTDLNNKLTEMSEKELFDIDYERVAIQWQPSVAQLYEDALKYETGSAISSAGALITASGTKRGRSPKDKRIVDEPSSSGDVWVMYIISPSIQSAGFYLVSSIP
jgi:hypothetical protein